MLKHLPEGLTPFEDCGFDRKPLYPLENEPVQAFCRTEEPPTLRLLTQEGETLLQPVPLDEKHYRFDLGSFPYGASVRYRLETASEQSRLFSFEPLREIVCSRPLSMLAQGDAVCLVFEAFHLLLTAGDVLAVSARTDAPPSWPSCREATLSLPASFSLHFSPFSDSDFLWELKRFSSQTILGVRSYTLRVGRETGVAQIAQEGSLNCRHVWGTGERFHQVDLFNGESNGRVVEKFTRQGDQTYLSIPFFMTDTGMGCRRCGTIPARWSFGADYAVSQPTRGPLLFQDEYFFGEPSQILRQFLFRTGRPVLPPDWAFGVWISANGWNCDAEVDAQIEALRRYDYPAEVMVLEAWSDERTFYRWNDAKHWRDPAATVRRIREAGLHLVLWQIPIVKYEWDGDPGEALLQDEREAIEKGYCVRTADGAPYRITENWFHNSLLPDFTNPEATRWWFDKRKPLLDMGVEGFKTDGGEFLFDYDVRLHDGATGLEAHNAYPAQYVSAYQDFLRQNGVNGVTFSRADYTGAQTRPVHWAGDQLSTWEELRSQLRAGISAGLSGVLFWSFDLGGFAGELPSAELYLRATAMACFCPVMQWHAEPRGGQFYATHGETFVNDRSPWNLAEKLNEPRVLELGVRFARIRARLKPYLLAEARHCTEAGRPLMAHLCLDFPEDEEACACNDQYMLGRRLLVAPIVEEGRTEREVYLPRGAWRHCFTGTTCRGGRRLTLPCPLDEIILLERLESHE